MSERDSILKDVPSVPSSAPSSSATEAQTEQPQRKPRKRILLNKIQTEKIPSIVSIFDVETFRLNTCFVENVQGKDVPWGVCTLDEPVKEGLEEALTAAAAPPAEAEDADAISDFLGNNAKLRTNTVKSYTYKTRKEFDQLYFPKTMKPWEKKLMLKLFRFIFGKTRGSIDEALVDKLLTPFDKLPCKEGSQSRLWELFVECIEYRIRGGDGTPGLKREIATMRGTVPNFNDVFQKKQYLLAQLVRMSHILQEEGRTCVNFSGAGGDIVLSEYHTAILDLIRKMVERFISQKLPVTEEEREQDFKEVMEELRGLEKLKGSNREIYTSIMTTLHSMFSDMGTVSTAIDESEDVVNQTDTVINRLTEALEKRTQKGGGSAPMTEDEDDDEYERVLTTAMGHLEGKSTKERERILRETNELLGGKTLDMAIEHAVTRKGFSVGSTMSGLREIDDLGTHGKSFLRCIQTLLERKERQYERFDPPPKRAPGKERYSYIMKKYPSLRKYIPKEVFRSRGSLDSVEAALRPVYPYTEALLEDIREIRKNPDPCCLFYKALLVEMKSAKKARASCKRIVELVPECERIVEEVLVLLSKEVVTEELIFKPVTLPAGFSLLAEAIRTHLHEEPPSLPITIHIHSPEDEFQEILGDSFLLIGSGTILHGLRNLEIDVSDEIDRIRRGEIAMGSILLLYLYMQCDRFIQ
jgi:hypothetical protein